MPRPAWALAAALPLCVAAPSPGQVPPDKAAATFTAGAGLQVELFAAEPMLENPTAIDIDPRGRVWVAEAVNYRRKNFNRPILREAGDRIVVLTDADGDGKADTSDVFYQGQELYGPLSVLVLPLPGAKQPNAARVLVAQSPDILEFTDADGDGKADGPPAKFLTGFGGFDHDHGVHGLTTGPDGKLYFTVGDEGVKGLQSKDGKGKKWVTTRSPKGDCQAGTVWRCDLDGTNVELIAHNFRNNYEAAVDSFGEIWCSDNDDDGNQQTRICHVMPGGNYGYWPRGPGQSHWHEEQPGVVHKTLRTGFGSPTGIAFYEGNLLPKLTGQLLHCDAGPREVRAFNRKPKGAGYELDKTVLLTSTDNWFRPSDVCVAPDGSVFVADWYDPGVGGHGMGDHTRGRIYRLTPKGHARYKVPAVDVASTDGVLATLGSPATSVRAVAQQRLVAMTTDAARDLLKAGFENRIDPLLLARVKTELALLRQRAQKRPRNLVRSRLDKTFEDRIAEQSIRILGYPGTPKYEFSSLGDVVSLAEPGPVRNALAREALLVLGRTNAEEDYVNAVFYTIAKLYDGRDRFYLAALNIACGTDPARRDAILADFATQFPDWNDKVADLVWELRPKSMLPKLGALMADPKLSAGQKARIVDILAVSDDPAAGVTTLGLLTGDQPAEVKARALDNLKLFLPAKWAAVAKSDALTAAVRGLLAGPDPAAGLQLVAAANSTSALDTVARIAADAGRPADVRSEAVRTLGALKSEAAVAALAPLLTDKAVARDAVRAVAEQTAGRPGGPAARQALALLEGLVTGPAAGELRQAALAALAGTRAGTGYLLKLQEAKRFPADLTADAGRLLRQSPFQGERNKAMVLFPAPGKLDPKRLPTSAALARRQGDAANGKRILLASGTSEAQCLKCHMVGGRGGRIGPDLSLIGVKGSKENLFDSLIHPSKAIADQYATWQVETDDGQALSGLLVGETETTMTLRDANGKDYQLPLKGVERKKSLVSLMPEGLVAALTEDELVDLVAYLMTLRTPSLSPEAWTLHGPFPAADDRALDAALPPLGSPKTVRADAGGYFDLAALHGDKAAGSLSVLEVTVVSPSRQAVTLALGTDDGCRLSVNGKGVLAHDRHEAAAPGRDRVAVTLEPGENRVRLVVGNGDGGHGFYFTIEGGADLRVK